MNRHLDWSGCYNVRDLGALPAANGRRTRRGAIVRADLLGRLTDEGKQQLVDYGIRTIVDLRTPAELQSDPPADFDGLGADLQYVNISIDEQQRHVRELMEQVMPDMGGVYNLSLDHYGGSHAAVMRAIFEARQGGVVLHCRSGKDRTGVMAALLLALAGVPDDLIAADYAATQERLRPAYEAWLTTASEEEKANPWSKPTTDPQTMYDVLAHLRATYDGPTGYFQYIGLTPAEISTLRARLLS